MMVEPVVVPAGAVPPQATAARAATATNANLRSAMVTTSPEKSRSPTGKILLRPLRAGDLRLGDLHGPGVASPRQGGGDHNRHAKHGGDQEKLPVLVLLGKKGAQSSPDRPTH